MKEAILGVLEGLVQQAHFLLGIAKGMGHTSLWRLIKGDAYG
jgi:hypothetical protein